MPTANKKRVFEADEMKFLVLLRVMKQRVPREERMLFTFHCPAGSESIFWEELAGIAANRLGTRNRFIEGGGRIKINRQQKVVRVYDTACMYGPACKEHVRELFKEAMQAEGLDDFRLEVYNAVTRRRVRKVALRDRRQFKLP